MLNQADFQAQERRLPTCFVEFALGFRGDGKALLDRYGPLEVCRLYDQVEHPGIFGDVGNVMTDAP
jgi:hypothetical protein